MFDRIFGEGGPGGGPDDLLWLLDRTNAEKLPPLYLCCGTEDMLIDDNRSLVAQADAAGIDVTADFGPGDHDWAYWDTTIQDVLAWLPLRP